jgi:hypothetical protein
MRWATKRNTLPVRFRRMKLNEKSKLITSPYKCPMHRMWMKKGQCEMCRLEEDRRRIELEKLTGAHKPEVIIGKI